MNFLKNLPRSFASPIFRFPLGVWHMQIEPFNHFGGIFLTKVTWRMEYEENV